MGCHFLLQCRKVKNESENESCSVMSDLQQPYGLQPHQAPLSMGFSRQEYWSGVPLPSPHAKYAATAKLLQSCPTLCDPTDGSPPGSPIPWILQARTLEWVHFLLQCRKVKSESEVAQLCLTLSNSMDCSPPGSSIHRIFQARVLQWGAIIFSN